MKNLFKIETKSSLKGIVSVLKEARFAKHYIITINAIEHLCDLEWDINTGRSYIELNNFFAKKIFNVNTNSDIKIQITSFADNSEINAKDNDSSSKYLDSSMITIESIKNQISKTAELKKIESKKNAKKYIDSLPKKELNYTEQVLAGCYFENN